LKIESYAHFSFIYFACIVGVSIIVVFALFAIDRCRNVHLTEVDMTQLTEKDRKYALDALGVDSVYQFFLSKSYVGWSIALAIVAFQIAMLCEFVKAAEVDLSNDNVDIKYTYRCPRDQVECDDTADLNWQGWAIFAVLMVSHLLKDIINGTKITILSAKNRHPRHDRLRFFCGGLLLNSVALFTLFVSTIYNRAIATSNTEVIMNAVVILFITDTDEQMYNILMAISSEWVASVSRGKTNGDKRDDSDAYIRLEDVINKNTVLEGDVKNMGNELKKVRQQMKEMQAMLEAMAASSAQEAPTRRLSGASTEKERPCFNSGVGASVTSYNAMDPNASDEKEELTGYGEMI